MKYLLSKKLTILFLFIANVTFSQDVPNRSVLNLYSLQPVDAAPRDVKGTSYINQDFSPAKVGNESTIYLLRYNVYKDEMEVERDNVIYFLSKSNNLIFNFINDKKVYQIFDYTDDGQPKTGYFNVLYTSEKFSLILKEKIKLIPAVQPKSGYDEYKPPTLKREKDILYIAYKNNTLTELPSKKKDFIKLFSSNAENIEKYISKNKLNIKHSEDLVQIFKYYNTLK